MSYTFEYIALVLVISVFAGAFAFVGSVSLALAGAIIGILAIVIIAFLLGRKFGLDVSKK